MNGAEVNTNGQVSLWQGPGILSSSNANGDPEIRETLKEVPLWVDMLTPKEERRREFLSVASNI